MGSPRLQAEQLHVAEPAEGRGLRNGQGQLVHDNAGVCVCHAGCVFGYGRCRRSVARIKA